MVLLGRVRMSVVLMSVFSHLVQRSHMMLNSLVMMVWVAVMPTFDFIRMC